ncbi:MAG: hypothetical protein V1720_02160 [bacterium]
MKKITLIILLLGFTVSLHAQLVIDSSSVDLNDRVQALVIYGENKYLYTEKGLIYLTGKDPYEEYYRKIYSDSTITNPNTVINSNSNMNSLFYFMPAMNVRDWADDYININDSIYLKDIFLLNNGAVVINPDMEKYLQQVGREKKK